MILRIRANFISLSLKSPSSYIKKTKGKKKKKKKSGQVYFAAKYEIKCVVFFFDNPIPFRISNWSFRIL